MDVRRLEPSEVEVFVDDLWLPFAEEMADLDPFNAVAEDARAAALEHRRERLARDDAVDYVVEDGGLVAGAAAESRDAPPVFQHGDGLHVNEVYVRPAYRRQGIASDLLAELEDWGRERGCTYVTLTVNRRNESAQELYRKRDYTVERHEMRKGL